uniref:hypothetical protein n=1 Tax=Lachnoclostridium phocaeense TaxID=1871021 RepID=UPI0026DAD6A6|nr:hypothetical protein [Lachnoclostridium phocaeense]
MRYIVDILQFAVVILIVGLIAERFMSKKGKEVKNINYYLKKGNSLPISILKAVGAGYVWWYKTFFKVVVVAVLSWFGAPMTREEEQEQEDLEYMMYMQQQEEENK